MKKILMLVVFVLLASCSSELTYSEIQLDRVKKDVRFFLESVEKDNGVHLYLDGENVVYVMLNGQNIMQGEKAIHFRDVHVDSEGDILNIHYIDEETDDYSDAALKNQILIKITKDKDYDQIRSYRNGKEVPFGLVSGN